MRTPLRLFREQQDRWISQRVMRRLDEVLVADVSHHWIVHAKAVLVGLLGLAALVGSLVVSVASGVLAVVGLVLVLWAVWKFLAGSADRLILTNLRVFRVQGVFTRTVATMPIAKVLDTTMTRPALGVLLGYGHFVFENAAQDQGMRELYYLPHPTQLDLTIQELVHGAGQGRGLSSAARSPD